jgi:dihydroorotase
VNCLIVDSILTNAKAYLKGHIVECSIAIEEGKIFKIGKETQMPNADERINLKNFLVLPGLIDTHVHLRDEGKAYKEDFYTGTAAAAAGGFTSVLDMPNNDPVTMSVETLRNRMNVAKEKVLVNVGFFCEFPNNLAEIKEIISQGALAFKLFMASQVGGLNVDDDLALQKAFKEVSKLKAPVAVHAEDKALLSANKQKIEQDKKNGIAAFLKAHSEEVELKAIERLFRVSAQTDVQLHVCHVSTEEGLDKVAEAKRNGKVVTCEVTPNHLFLSRADMEQYGQMLALLPPLRSKNHVQALWKRLAEGWIDVIGSDHAPHAFSEKSASSIWDVKVGIPGLETTLPLTLMLIRKRQLTLGHVVQLLAETPAKLYGLNDLGVLEQGKAADLTIVDFNRQFKIDALKFKSKAKFSPYDKWEVQGKPVKTIVNGQVIMDEGEIIAKAGSGSIIRRANK